MHRAEIAYPLEYRLTLEAAERNAQAIQEATPLLAGLNTEMRRIVTSTDTPRKKLLALRELADQLADVVGPRSACRMGCAHCCHIAVSLTSAEARLIGQEIGRTPAGTKTTKLSRKARKRFVQDRFGQPCTFLEDARCGIYEYRPLACRLHFNIGHSPFFCSAEVDPAESVVPNVDFSAFWAGVVLALKGWDYGDIQGFFPQGADRAR